METFAKRFNLALEIKKITPATLSKSTGINEGTLSNYRKGKYAPKQQRTELIANALGVSPAWLMGADVPMSGSPVQDLQPVMQLYRIPIYDSVSAGFGALAINEIKDYTELPFSSAAEAGETLCIIVHGDSMSPRIQDGDLIQVQRQDSVDSGDIAAVLLDGDNGLVKKVTYGPEWIRLISLNPAYPPVELNGAEVLRCRIVGKVKRVIRDI